MEMGCCHQTVHVGCLFCWWIDRHKWTCPHCRDVYLEGKDTDYPSKGGRDRPLTQVVDAIPCTIWELDTRPDLYEDPEHQHAIVISDSDDDEEDRFEFVVILDDDLSTLEILLCY